MKQYYILLARNHPTLLISGISSFACLNLIQLKTMTYLLTLIATLTGAPLAWNYSGTECWWNLFLENTPYIWKYFVLYIRTGSSCPSPPNCFDLLRLWIEPRTS